MPKLPPTIFARSGTRFAACRVNVGNGIDALVQGLSAKRRARCTGSSGVLIFCQVRNSGSLWMPTVGSTVILDRLGPKRSDAEFLKSKLEAPGSRFLVLADLKPVIRSNAQRTEAKLAWFSYAELTKFGLPSGEALFLGIDKASNAH